MRVWVKIRGLAQALLAALVVACGGGGGDGGGGGGSGTAPLQYSGSTSAAVITTTNAAALTANLTGATDVAAATSAVSASDQATSAQGMRQLANSLTQVLRSALDQQGTVDSGLTSVLFDDTQACDNGGTVRVSGDVDPLSGTGTANVTYTNCQVDQDAISGQATMRIDRAVTGAVFIPTDFTLTFPRLTLRGSVNIDIGGSIRVVAGDFIQGLETITENVVVLHNSTGRMTKTENMVYVDRYDNIDNPTTYTETMTGRLFDSVHGFVDITTITPLLFSSATQQFPNGGLLQLASGGRRIHATAFSSGIVRIALDLDNDGAFETRAMLGWAQLSGPLGADLGDSDSDGLHNSWETANAVNDPAQDSDGDGFSNLSEYLGGGNPTVQASVPGLIAGTFTLAADISSANSDTEVPGRSSIASDGTNYLVVSCRQEPPAGVFGTVVSDAGQVLNSFPISNDACPQRTAAAFDGTNYLVVVSRGGQLFGIRITGAGNILDPGGGFVISSIADNSTHFLPAAAFDGQNYLVVWRKFVNSSSQIQGARVTPSASVSEFLVGIGDSSPFVAFGGGRYLVAWTSSTAGSEDVVGQLVETNMSLAGGPIAIAQLPDRQFASGVAFDGTNFLVTWDHTATIGISPPPDGKVFGRRLVASTGALLDGPTGIEIAIGAFQNHSSSVAFAGSSFVVTWAVSSFPNFPPAGIYAARVSKNGVRVDGPPTEIGVPISGSPPPASRFVHPVAASNGPSALIVWVNNIEVGTAKDIQAATIFGP